MNLGDQQVTDLKDFIHFAQSSQLAGVLPDDWIFFFVLS